ncbi:hypothetical protein SAMD00019534_070150 [Acytostelium subglobosum LB1]|uniref:hypothetical protein n=1 Tax=Acytostelium subglobosum LB1 TaxID=1410327 RepID=UPI000644E9E0|nr:hypothetical protein SAMD00019534_070150 [Acytostelium subglobosum LB1]GAM23840.1 hypothetical protein SAMD00019534_070150 [Acytostelium subglobosum LB1]|eukprot:XP_012752876.1 hypothetical protein SAMD00019534_070150 [Acytostelium subglobosum LB1]
MDLQELVVESLLRPFFSHQLVEFECALYDFARADVHNQFFDSHLQLIVDSQTALFHAMLRLSLVSWRWFTRLSRLFSNHVSISVSPHGSGAPECTLYLSQPFQMHHIYHTMWSFRPRFAIPSSLVRASVPHNLYSLFQPSYTNRISLVLRQEHSDIPTLLGLFPNVARVDVYALYPCIESASRYIKQLSSPPMATLTAFFDWASQYSILEEWNWQQIPTPTHHNGRRQLDGSSLYGHTHLVLPSCCAAIPSYAQNACQSASQVSITLIEHHESPFEEYMRHHLPGLLPDIASIGAFLQEVDLGDHAVSPALLANIVRGAINIKSIVVKLAFDEQQEDQAREPQYWEMCSALATSPHLAKLALSLRVQLVHGTDPDDTLLPKGFYKLQSINSFKGAGPSVIHSHSASFETHHTDIHLSLCVAESAQGHADTSFSIHILYEYDVEDVILAALSNDNSIDHFKLTGPGDMNWKEGGKHRCIAAIKANDHIQSLECDVLGRDYIKARQFPSIQRMDYSFFL